MRSETLCHSTLLISIIVLQLQFVRRNDFPYAGHCWLSLCLFPPQYLHDCLPEIGSYCALCCSSFSLLTYTITASSSLPPITVNCSHVTSLIRSDSIAFVRLHSFSLNRRALAALSRAPSTSLSRNISSCQPSGESREDIVNCFIRLLLRIVKNIPFVKNVPFWSEVFF